MMNFLTFTVLPVYTVLLASGYCPFSFNFSVIGYSLGRRDAFLLWGLLVGICYTKTLEVIGDSLERRRLLSPRTRTLFKAFIPFDLFLLFCAVTTPYLPEVFPLKAFLHIIFAAAAAVLLLMALSVLTWQLSRLDRSYRSYFYSCTGIFIISALLLVLAGIVSSLLEIFFTLSTVWLADLLKKKLSDTAGSAPSGQ